jgi:phenylpyruvate tautomerase PptA (4-oxalocrotonate tautomerase family)
MPLVEITAPAGALPGPAFATVQKSVADAVLKWMELPQTDFFAGATWVYVHDTGKGSAATGAAGVEPGFLVVVTPLEGFLTPEKNESLAKEIAAVLQEACGKEHPVWTLVNEVPEGFWAVNGSLTRRAKLDDLIAQSSTR